LTVLTAARCFKRLDTAPMDAFVWVGTCLKYTTRPRDRKMVSTT
jgi:hypothetical protein